MNDLESKQLLRFWGTFICVAVDRTFKAVMLAPVAILRTLISKSMHEKLNYGHCASHHGLFLLPIVQPRSIPMSKFLLEKLIMKEISVAIAWSAIWVTVSILLMIAVLFLCLQKLSPMSMTIKQNVLYSELQLWIDIVLFKKKDLLLVTLSFKVLLSFSMWLGKVFRGFEEQLC